MQFHSTKNQDLKASLEDAIFKSLPSDNGLYMPDSIPPMPDTFLKRLPELSFNEIAEAVTLNLLGDDLSEDDVRKIVERAFDFDAPVRPLGENLNVLELFHGPSMAFKDFGARYMASLMSHFLSRSNKEIHILVATSGDTGGAVAQGFFGVPGIKVTILYPSGKVSEIQEKQLTTLGGNVTALEVNGTFDDCQALVKQAFLDKDLNEKFNLSSANSINISRLIPQSFYYFSAYAQLAAIGRPIVFSVPSGNFGNLSAGLLAWKMGLPVEKFIAATNLNNVVPRYLESGSYIPHDSTATLSNAMDVGNPSNFVRLSRLLNDDLHTIRKMVSGYFYDDDQTRRIMRQVREQFGYVMCPHTAVAYLGLKDFLGGDSEKFSGVFLSTAHPAKFLDLVEDTLGEKIEIPENLEKFLSADKESIKMSNSFNDFKSWLLN